MIGELGGDNGEMGLGSFNEDIKVKDDKEGKRRNGEERVSLEDAKGERKIVDEAIGLGKRGARKEEGLVLGLGEEGSAGDLRRWVGV